MRHTYHVPTVKHVIFSLFLFCFPFSSQLSAKPVKVEQVRKIADTFLEAQNIRQGKRLEALKKERAQGALPQKFTVVNVKEVHGDKGEILAYVVELEPQGFIATAADSDISPVLGYSFQGKFPFEDSQQNVLLHLVKCDIQGRKKEMNPSSEGMKTLAQSNNTLWDKYTSFENGLVGDLSSAIQWPDPCQYGHEGWITSHWDQDWYWNSFCPRQLPVTDPWSSPDVRCHVGCGATAMAQILNYWKYPPCVNFSFLDMYPSLGDVGVIIVDTDAVHWDFPSFSELNSALSVVDYNESQNQQAYLSFAAGIKSKTWYGKKISGTFPNFVWWGYLAGFQYGSAICDISYPFHDAWVTRKTNVIENIKKGWPVQLSISTPQGEGHAVVVDGYKDTGEFHINCGKSEHGDWWYFIPDINTLNAPNKWDYAFNLVTSVIDDICPYGGWRQYGADQRNTFYTPYIAPTTDPPASKWQVMCSSNYRFNGVSVGTGNKIYISCSPTSVPGPNPSVWIVNQYGVKEKELVLTNENRELTYPVQNSKGDIFVGTGSGRVYRIDTVTDSNTLIFSEPSSKQLQQKLKIDDEGYLYAYTLNKLYCMDASGNVKWSFPLSSNQTFLDDKGPAIDIGRERVYVTFNDGNINKSILLCLNRTNGQQVATRPDCGGTPSVDQDGTVYIAGTDRILALNPANITGPAKWDIPVGSSTFYSNAPAIGTDGTLYFSYKVSSGGSYYINFRAVRSSDGTTKWGEVSQVSLTDDVIQPYCAGNKVVVFTFYHHPGGVESYELKAYRDQGDAYQSLWTRTYNGSAGDVAFGPGATLYVVPVTGGGQWLYALSEGPVGDPYGAAMGWTNNLPPTVPANPTPQHLAEDVGPTARLSWDCNDPEGNSVTYNVCLGESDYGMTTTAQINHNYFEFEALKPGTNYVWTVTTTDGQAITQGPMWTFRTKPINCDLNAKSPVNFEDYAILARHWLDTCLAAGGCEGADINWDKTVNIDDLALFVSNWLKTTGTFCTCLNWTPDAGTRIFGTYNAAIPRFVRALPGGGWGMYYYEGDSWTYGDTGYATSNDGMTWSRVGRVMCHGAHDFDNINAVITDIVNLTDGNLRAYCEGMAFTGSGASNIFIADSTDGINWVDPQVVFMPQSGTLYSNQVGCPRIIKAGEEFVMYFVGSDDTTSRIFKTTSSDGISNWTPPQIVVEPPTGGSLGSFYIVNCPETGQLRMFVTTKFSTDSGDCIRSLISVDNGSNWTWEDGIRLAPNGYSVENLICPVLAEIAGSGKMYVGGGHGGYGGGHWDTLSATCE